MIQVLDCTLRDGGYVNNWQFGQATWIRIVQALIDGGIDIIEIGYLNSGKGAEQGTTVFNSIEVPSRMLKDIRRRSKDVTFCVMLNSNDQVAADFPICDPEGVTGIRLAFHKEQRDSAVGEAKALTLKGYQVFLQPMVTTAYTAEEIKILIKAFKEINIFAIYIVDSFGIMFREDFARLQQVFAREVPVGTRLGYHAHNNFQLAYSHAMDFVQGLSGRELIVDASLLGMGRGAGNLNTELLVHYLNRFHGGRYQLLPLLECIDSCVETIYRENYWGYSIVYFLSATMNCHPNYASYFINKKTLSVVDIEKILRSIPEEKKRLFSKDYAEELYQLSRAVKIQEPNIPADLLKGRKVVLLASGASVRDYMDTVRQRVREEDALLVAVNHIPSGIGPDLLFFSNQKRYDEFADRLDVKTLIVTNNILLQDRHKGCMAADYAPLAAATSHHSDNVAVLFMNLFISQGGQEIAVAGLDGYRMHSDENYSYPEFGRIIEKDELVAQNESIALALRELKKKIHIEFLTPSIFKECVG